MRIIVHRHLPLGRNCQPLFDFLLLSIEVHVLEVFPLSLCGLNISTHKLCIHHRGFCIIHINITDYWSFTMVVDVVWTLTFPEALHHLYPCWDYLHLLKLRIISSEVSMACSTVTWLLCRVGESYKFMSAPAPENMILALVSAPCKMFPWFWLQLLLEPKSAGSDQWRLVIRLEKNPSVALEVSAEPLLWNFGAVVNAWNFS